jgi:23S rRNA (adenine2503-C2)-methyltransferase
MPVATRYDLARADLDAIVAGWGEPSYRAGQGWDGLHTRLAEPEEMTELPKALRARVADALPAALAPVDERVSDHGDTVKWLWQLRDGVTVETVLMHYGDRATVCVSTQAGCAMGCGFCATGQAGFERHLSVGEIVEQVVRASRRARTDGHRLSNVVLMGMGEPLANYDASVGSLRRMRDDLGLSARHLTLSTVGIVPGIRRLAAEGLPVNLAVSLHAADDQLRDELVPINRRYPIAMLVDACREWLSATGRRLSFEWALIDGVNDRPVDAGRLHAVCRSLPLPAHVNLIPLNPTPGYPVRGTPSAGVRAFRDRLRALGVNATVRRNRGTDIDAACGQLRELHQRTSTVMVSPTRTASTNRSPGHTTPPGQTTDRSSDPATSAPAPTTGAPPDQDKLAAR